VRHANAARAIAIIAGVACFLAMSSAASAQSVSCKTPPGLWAVRAVACRAPLEQQMQVALAYLAAHNLTPLPPPSGWVPH